MALVTARPVSQLLCIFPDVAKRCVMQVDGRHGVWFAKQGAMEQPQLAYAECQYALSLGTHTINTVCMSPAQATSNGPLPPGKAVNSCEVALHFLFLRQLNEFAPEIGVHWVKALLGQAA